MGVRARLVGVLVAGLLGGTACAGGGDDGSLAFDTGPSRPYYPPADVLLPARDTAGATDVLGPDVPAPRDVAIPDLGPREVTGVDRDEPGPDLPPCAACPPDAPLCVDGRCTCSGTSCGAGRVCEGGTCVACTTDARCGAGCEDCRSTSRVCADDGTRCVVCKVGRDCPSGSFCDAGVCRPCDSDAHCGPTCGACTATSPVCDNGFCECLEGTCGPGSFCLNGVCAPCKTDAFCGPSCVDCTVTPSLRCLEATTCGCGTSADCALGYACETGICVACGPDDDAHCGEACAVCGGATPLCVDGRCACRTDADCGEAALCDGGGCTPCDTPAHCGAGCAACPEERPLCDGGACVACTAAAPCSAGAFCDAGTCAPCGDSDPAHCGAACAACTGTTPVCAAGACVCDEDSCGAFFRCEGGACAACDTDGSCGAECVACETPTPFCRPDGRACAACRSDADCAAHERCDDGGCVPRCTSDGCLSDGSPDAETCGRARVVGRLDALAGYRIASSTEDRRNDDDLPSLGMGNCWDGKYDLFYRVYLLAGDRLSAVVTPGTTSFNISLKLYDGTSCDDDGHDDLLTCRNEEGDGDPESATHTAAHDGWVTIVVDGARSFDEDTDWGPFALDLTLTCGEAACCCY